MFVYLSLVIGVVVALAISLSVMSTARAQDLPVCEKEDSLQVPGAVEQDKYCLADLSTKGLINGVHTNTDDWAGLSAAETIPPYSSDTRNPEVIVPGVQIDGYFEDTSKTNCNNAAEWQDLQCHDAQFVIRVPNEWNGKLVITGAPGVRRQYANDFIISDWVLSKGYAFASTDKGNTGTSFYDDDSEPGGSVVEWHERVEELTKAAQKMLEDSSYGKAPDYTYITGISNGGYLTRYALENNPELYDGGVDWEGTLFRRNGPNLFTYLPVALRNYPECKSGNGRACERMVRAGFQKSSKFLWEEHYFEYWDLTQRIYREEFDPEYDGDQKAGTAFCQEDGDPETPCDAEYRYEDRPREVKEAVEKVSLTGKIGKPMLTLHGTLDALLPIKTDSNVYRQLIENAGKGNLHRYYKIQGGTHVDSYYDRPIPEYREKLRPLLPCHRAAFVELEEWVEEDNGPPKSKYVQRPEDSEVDAANYCSLGKEATYSAPGP